jgi:hypothetical protein
MVPYGAVTRKLVISLGTVLALIRGGQGAETRGFSPRLAAVRLSADSVHPGGTLRASYEWVNLGTAPAEEEYTVLVHVRPAVPGDPDISPATGGDFRPSTPTFAWLPRVLVQEPEHGLKIPDDFPPGRYRVLIGLYSQETGQRHRLANDDRAVPGLRYRIGSLEVVPKDKPLASRPITLRLYDTQGLPQGVDPAVPPRGGTIELDNPRLRVALSAQRPLVLGYELPNRKQLPGDSSGYPLRVRICRVSSNGCRTICLRDPNSFVLRRRPAEARYTVHVADQGTPAVSFDLVFRVRENVLGVRVECVREEPGYLLMDIFTPQLVSARGAEGQLVVPSQSGRLVHLGRSAPGCHVIGMNWTEADLCGAVVGEGLAAAIRTRDWDNELEARVAGPQGRLTGGYAVRLALRADAVGRAAKTRLAEEPAVAVAILGGDGDERPPTWVETAKWLRRGMEGSPNPLYRNTCIYKIFCDSPGAGDYTTFDDALDVIRRVHQVAPWLKQVVYLVGWQYRGHDTQRP